MASEALQRARDYEKRRLPRVPAETLPAYHVTGGVGWINDPNGFSAYRGEYHLFFQYYPYDTTWGPMHWGHVKTKDLVRWERLPAALAPDAPYDRDGCFSGSAVELPDGRQLLMYTGVRREGAETEYQTQCLAIGNGVDYEKYPGNPVLTAADVPAGGSARDFRDPKLWYADGSYHAVAGNRAEDGSGQILLYESDDALHWRYDGVLAACRNEYGRMWECPDFFPLDGKHVLLTSPQEMAGDGLEFRAGYGTLCLIGTYDREQRRLLRERAQAVDYGLDFYAPQTLETPDGRRIMIAWMQDWETSGFHPAGLAFQGQMTIPRELRIRDGKLIQTPVRELARYHSARTAYRDVPVSGETMLPGVSGRVLDMTVTVRPGSGAEPYRSFRLELARGGGHAVAVRFSPETGIVRIDRSRGSFPPSIANTRDFHVASRQGTLRLRILLDRYSLELFVNDGEQAASCVFYAPAEASSIRFISDGPVLMDVEKYDLRFDDSGAARARPE